jgi:hypothetical protein
MDTGQCYMDVQGILKSVALLSKVSGAVTQATKGMFSLEVCSLMTLTIVPSVYLRIAAHFWLLL